jgi:hypothetical protein
MTYGYQAKLIEDTIANYILFRVEKGHLKTLGDILKIGHCQTVLDMPAYLFDLGP